MLVSSVIPTFLSNSDEFTNDLKEDRMTSLLEHNEAEPNEYRCLTDYLDLDQGQL